jgi:hypothetical protein
VPAAIWKKLLEFIADERSGTIALHVRAGRVRTATISEQVPAKAARPTADPTRVEGRT